MILSHNHMLFLLKTTNTRLTTAKTTSKTTNATTAANAKIATFAIG